MNGYIGFYRGKQYEVYANTTYEAQCKLATQLKAKKSWEISVFLCEKNGQEVVHTPTF